MSHVDTAIPTSIVAVYADHDSAAQAVRCLHEAGIAMSDLSIVGRDFQTTEEPVGFVSAGEYATAGAATGAWFGGLLGLCVGAAFLVLPGLGPIVVAGPLTAALLGGIEGALAGTALGSLGGALVGWGVPREKALKFETQVNGGKYLVVVRGEPEVLVRAHELLDRPSADVELFHPATA
jgi:outer membrane lipoprotein SlyB